MRTLPLDTHSLLWWINRPQLLSVDARREIAERRNRVLVSAASVYELAFKHRLSKLDEATTLVETFALWIGDEGFEHLDITHEHAMTAGRFDPRRRDPFDRLLTAQASIEGVELVSNEKLFDSFGVRRLW